MENTTYKRYPAYKDSGVKWIGEIPSHWKLLRLGSYFKERKTKVSDKDFPPLSVTKSGILPQLATAAKTNDGDNRKLVKEGDFVINSRSDRKGSSGIAKQDGSVSLINIVLEPEEIDPDFCNFLLKCYAFIEEFYRNGHGIVADLWTTRYDEMKNIKISIPPLSTQTAIANFLDEKTSKIDKAIEQKEALIALLKERKQILIQDLVTGKKVWNGTTWAKPEKTKDSGVEWIGEIPEEWEVTKLKYFINILSGFAFPSSSFTENGTKLLRGINVSVANIRWNDTVYWDKNKVKGLQQYLLSEGDLVLGMDRPIISEGLRLAKISKKDLPCLLLQRVTKISVLKGLCQAYLELILNCSHFTDYLEPIFSGVSVPHLSPEQIQNFLFVFPPKNIQQEIVDYIENQSQKIDQSIGLQAQQIEKLKEYKTVLIDGAVTGKIKIP